MVNNNSLLEEVTPLEFYLSQNYPNPFKDKTTIKYCVSYRTHVDLIVLDNEGNEIEKLVDEEKNPGTYEVEFQSTIRGSSKGVPSRSAMESYYYRLEAGEYRSEKKMVFEK